MLLLLGMAAARARARSPVNLYCANSSARAREAEPSDALRQQTDPRSATRWRRLLAAVADYRFVAKFGSGLIPFS